MNVIIITQARVGSSRLSNKVLLKIGNDSLLGIHLRRLKKSKKASMVLLATTFEKGVNKILKIAQKEKVLIFQGSTENVLERFYKSVKNKKPDYIVRVTSDCPLIDPKLIDDVIEFAIKKKSDYVSNVLIHNFPDGQDIEVIKFTALELAWKNAKLKSEIEHVTPYLINNSDFNNKNIFKSFNYSINLSRDYSKARMTVDVKSDYDLIKNLIKIKGSNCDWIVYADYILDNEKMFNNQLLIRNESYLNQLEKEQNEE